MYPVSEKYKISASAACRAFNRYKTEGMLEARPRSGRPSIFSKRDESFLIREIVADPSKPSSELTESICTIKKANINSSTIRKFLIRKGLKTYSATKKPYLTKKMKKARLDWCKQYKDKSIDFWKQHLFSDETTICINLSTIMNQVRRFPSSNALLPKYHQSSVKHPQYVMFWGSFSYNGIGSLIPLESTMNSEKYINLLARTLDTDMTKLNCTSFQQDNAPCHKSKAVLKWFENNNINVLNWPSNSPDLNPIENLWHILKRKLKRRCIKNKLEIKYFAKKEWDLITNELAQKLVNSMPKRIELVMKAKGNAINY